MLKVRIKNETTKFNLMFGSSDYFTIFVVNIKTKDR